MGLWVRDVQHSVPRPISVSALLLFHSQAALTSTLLFLTRFHNHPFLPPVSVTVTVSETARFCTPAAKVKDVGSAVAVVGEVLEYSRKLAKYANEEDLVPGLGHVSLAGGALTQEGRQRDVKDLYKVRFFDDFLAVSWRFFCGYLAVFEGGGRLEVGGYCGGWGGRGRKVLVFGSWWTVRILCWHAVHDPCHTVLHV